MKSVLREKMTEKNHDKKSNSMTSDKICESSRLTTQTIQTTTNEKDDTVLNDVI